MDDSFFDIILIFAFEKMIKCENKRKININNFYNYRVKIVELIKNNYNSIIKDLDDDSINRLNSFIEINENMSLDDEIKKIKLFINNNDEYRLEDDYIILDDDISYDDVIEVKYSDSSVISSIIYRFASSFDAYEVLGTMSIVNDVTKMINAEKYIEEAFMNNDKDLDLVTDIGNYYINSKFATLAVKPFYVIDEYYSTLNNLTKNNSNNLMEKIISKNTRLSNEYFLNNSFIEGELTNIYQTAIFDSNKHYGNSLLNHFDDVWDYVYSDDYNKDDEDIDEDSFDEEYEEFDDEDSFDEEYDNYYDPDSIILYFYMNYLLRINDYLNVKNSKEMENTKKRLLYALNYYDGKLSDTNHFMDKYKSLYKELMYSDRSSYDDFFLMSMIFLSDMLDGNIDELSLRKVIFISCYYDLTLDFRIKKTLDNSVKENSEIGIILCDGILNHNYKIFDSENINKIKNKIKE